MKGKKIAFKTPFALYDNGSISKTYLLDFLYDYDDEFRKPSWFSFIKNPQRRSKYFPTYHPPISLGIEVLEERFPELFNKYTNSISWPR